MPYAHAASDAVFLFELIDTTAGIDKLLRARKERVADRANFHAQVLFDRSRFERIAAGARNGRYMILRMNIGFHHIHLFPP